MRVFLLVFLISTNFIYASQSFIVNGLKTNDFKPVVKLSLGSSYESEYEREYGLCTGTFISRNAIITAAHCLQSLYLERKLFEINYITSNEAFSSKQYVDIKINDEEESRVNFVYFHGGYVHGLNAQSDSFEVLNSLIKEVKNKELDLEAARIKYRQYISTNFDKSNTEYDLVILEVTPKSSDSLYRVAQKTYQHKDDVVMVGFGNDIETIKVNKMNAEISYYQKLIAGNPYEEETEKYSKKLSLLMKKLRSHSGVKKFGYNRVTNIKPNGSYVLYGVRENAEQSWNEFTKKWVYSWREADGEDTSLSYGDSGGPLLVKSGDSYLVAAVASTVRHLPTDNSSIELNYTNLNTASSRFFIKETMKRINNIK